MGMVLLDSNIFIYIANGTCSPRVIAGQEIAHATITQIETLGYQDIRAVEEQLLEEIFQESHAFDLTDEIINAAIRLRRHAKMSLGDAIVAATALVHGCPLWTANIGDFSNIEGLTLHNPVN